MDVDISVGIFGEWAEDVGANGVEWLVDFNRAVRKCWSVGNRPKLLADGTGVDEANYVFTHPVPVMIGDFELSERGIYTAMTEDVIMRGFNDDEVLLRD